jgi:hypothetical protein
VAKHSGYLAGPVSHDRIKEGSIGLLLMAPIYQTQRFGAPKPSTAVFRKDMAAFHTFDLVYMLGVGMHRQVNKLVNMYANIEMEVSMLVFFVLVGQCFGSIYLVLFNEMSQLLFACLS